MKLRCALVVYSFKPDVNEAEFGEEQVADFLHGVITNSTLGPNCDHLTVHCVEMIGKVVGDAETNPPV